MSRILLIVALGVFSASPAGATHFWISQHSNFGGTLGSVPPASATAVPTFYNFIGQTSGSFYIWARPDAGQTLKNWSLELHSSDANILDFTTSTIYNPMLSNGKLRWEYALNTSTVDLMGITLTTAAASGINIANWSIDPLYFGPADGSGGWLVGKVNYNLKNNLGLTDIYLKIGRLGMNNVGQTSSQTSVLFGHVGDTPFLNAHDYRQSIGSNAVDAKVRVLPTPDADFNNDLIANGADFLIWQRNVNSANTAHANGNANGDSAVNKIDLAAWAFQYGSAVPLMMPVPEPTTLALSWAIAWTLFTRRGRRGDA